MEIIKEAHDKAGWDNSQKLLNRNGHLKSTEATVYSLFVPLNYNNGRRVPKEELKKILSQIIHYAGGLTQYAPGVGFWVSPSSQMARDRVLPIQIVVPPSQEAEWWFTCFASELAVVLKQECIFLVAQPLWLMK